MIYREMTDATNLRKILIGERQRKADAEYEIARLERKLIMAKLDRDAAVVAIKMVEELIEKEEAE